MFRQQIHYFLRVCCVCACVIVHVCVCGCTHLFMDHCTFLSQSKGQVHSRSWPTSNSLFIPPYNKQRECNECHWRNKMRGEKKYHTWLSFYSVRCFSLSSSQSTSTSINLPLIPFLPVSNSHSYPIFSPFVFSTSLSFLPLVSLILYLLRLKRKCISAMAVVTSLRLTQFVIIVNNRNGNTFRHVLMLAWKCMQKIHFYYIGVCVCMHMCVCVSVVRGKKNL